MNKKAIMYFTIALAELILTAYSIRIGRLDEAFVAGVATVCFTLTAVLEARK